MDMCIFFFIKLKWVTKQHSNEVLQLHHLVLQMYECLVQTLTNHSYFNIYFNFFS